MTEQSQDQWKQLQFTDKEGNLYQLELLEKNLK